MPNPTPFADIRAAIVSVLEAAETIEAVYRTDRSKVDGYPVAIVSPSESEPDFFETAARSSRTVFVFNVRIMYPFTEGQDDADIALEKVCDEVLHLFGDRACLGDAADWVRPTPAAWGYVEGENGTKRVAVIKIEAQRFDRA